MRKWIILALLLIAPSVDAAPITAGTDLSTVLNTPGDYELQAGNHQVTTTFTMATSVRLTAAPGATLTIKNSQHLIFDDGNVISGVPFLMESGSRLQAAAVSGNTQVATATIIGNTFSQSGTVSTTPLIRIGQGFNSLHSNITIKDNVFDAVYILQEVGRNISYIGNRFYDMDGLRPIQLWGSDNRVIGNYVDGGVFGISILGKANIAADRASCTNNLIASNIVLNTSEEGISMDTVGNVAAEATIREYDTIKTATGTPIVTLNSANWAAQTTYTGSKYDLVVVSATNTSLVNRIFKITTHSGRNFTLDISADDYAKFSVGDGVAIALACTGNTIANNVVIPALFSDRANTTGITLHGQGIGNTIANNVVYGESDGVGSGDTDITKFGIREFSLNGITASDSVTGLQRRAPVGLNRIFNNRVIGGGFGAEYKDYGSNTSYTSSSSVYRNTASASTTRFGFYGGAHTDPGKAYKITSGSSLYSAGYPIPGLTDYQGRSFNSVPSIGAYEVTVGDFTNRGFVGFR